MKVSEYAALDAVSLAGLVSSGALSPSEVTDAAIGAIERLDPQLNAVVASDFARARERAAATDLRAPLAGVPFLLKDGDIYSEEWPTTFSSRFFAGARPRPDSEIVTRWRAAGVNILGKTNLPEFAGDFATEPYFRGITLNPWDTRVVVGGSSGGAAAAVASGMVPVAHGSDVGGSIRVPSACCGLFGLKPSRGLNPIGPYAAESGAGLNCEHVLSRTVRDSAAFLDATAGPEAGAPYRVRRSVPSYLSAIAERPGRLRIACVSRSIGGVPVEPEIGARLADAAALLERLGHEVVPSEHPAAATVTEEGWADLWMMDVALLIEERSAELGRGPAPDEIEPMARHVMERFAGLTALRYMAARRVAHQVCLAMARQFDGFDIILTPSTATLPPAVGSLLGNGPDFTYGAWAEIAYRFAPFSEVFNVTGQPAASVPLYQSESGLPIGMQIIGRQDEDHVVLRLAAELELAAPWHHRHPPIWAGSTADD